MVNVNMSYAVEQINTRCNLLALSRSRFLNMTPKQAEDHFERIINDRRPVSISVIRPTNEQVVLYQGLVNYCKDKLTVEEEQAQAAEDRAAQEILKAEAQAEAQAGAQAGAEAQMTPAQTAAAAAEEAVEAEADRQKREDAADKQHREVALLADANEKFEHFIEMIYSIEAASQQRRNNQEAFTYTNNIISGSDSLSPRTTNGTHVFKLLPPSYEDDSLYSDSEYYIKKLLGKTLRFLSRLQGGEPTYNDIIRNMDLKKLNIFEKDILEYFFVHNEYDINNRRRIHVSTNKLNIYTVSNYDPDRRRGRLSPPWSDPLRTFLQYDRDNNINNDRMRSALLPGIEIITISSNSGGRAGMQCMSSGYYTDNGVNIKYNKCVFSNLTVNIKMQADLFTYEDFVKLLILDSCHDMTKGKRLPEGGKLTGYISNSNAHTEKNRQFQAFVQLYKQAGILDARPMRYEIEADNKAARDRYLIHHNWCTIEVPCKYPKKWLASGDYNEDFEDGMVLWYSRDEARTRGGVPHYLPRPTNNIKLQAPENINKIYNSNDIVEPFNNGPDMDHDLTDENYINLSNACGDNNRKDLYTYCLAHNIDTGCEEGSIEIPWKINGNVIANGDLINYLKKIYRIEKVNEELSYEYRYEFEGGKHFTMKNKCILFYNGERKFNHSDKDKPEHVITYLVFNVYLITCEVEFFGRGGGEVKKYDLISYSIFVN